VTIKRFDDERYNACVYIFLRRLWVRSRHRRFPVIAGIGWFGGFIFYFYFSLAPEPEDRRRSPGRI
jgi:hypothetical protein